MLKEKDLDTRGSSVPWFAVKDAERYSDECRIIYSPSQRSQAETFKDIVSLGYSAKNIYITFRKKFIAIKVENPTPKNRRVINELHALCEERGYEKATTAQGIIYRIPKK
jgi:hypothetical protein